MDIGELIFMANKAGFKHFEGEYHINFQFEIYFQKGKKDNRSQMLVSKRFDEGKLKFDFIVTINDETLICAKDIDVSEFTQTYYSALMSFTIKNMATDMMDEDKSKKRQRKEK